MEGKYYALQWMNQVDSSGEIFISMFAGAFIALGIMALVSLAAAIGPRIDKWLDRT